MQIIIPLEEHKMIISKLINRINFIRSNYKMTQNTLDHLQMIMNSMTKINPPQIYIDVYGNSGNTTKLLNGGSLAMNNYKAIKSQGVIQGEGNSNNVIDTSENKTTIKIGSSFKERQIKLNDLETIIQELKKMPENKFKEDAVFNLRSAYEEIEEEATPNVSKLERFFRRAGEALKEITIGKELLDKISQVYTSFNIGDFLDDFNNMSN